VAEGDRVGATFEGLDGLGLRVGLVCARWNRPITDRLREGAHWGLDRLNVGRGDRREVWVPGSFEVPLAAQALAQRADVDAVICLGAVIRGETAHFDLVAGECARGIQRVQLETGVPIAFGVLTTDTEKQAMARSEGPDGHNVGEECAAVAIEMARLLGHLAR